MAATRLIALHINKGKTLAKCLAERTDYSENAKKTDDGKYISSYECNSKTCDEEFLLSKRQYEHITGRNQEHDVIAYQIRQSFKPGEVTPEEANKIGYELAKRFTKGKYAFIVATHIDKSHIHNHIIFNSTSLDCKRKFRNFFFSGIAVANLSDLICMEHNLSIINRKPYDERIKRTVYPKKETIRDTICKAIDEVLKELPKSFEELIIKLKQRGYEYKGGKNPALKGKGQKRFIRFSSLGKGYSVKELTSVISGSEKHISKFENRISKGNKLLHQKRELSFLIDIEEKMKMGKGIGYAKWAKVFNLKQMANAMLFMEEHNIKNYDELKRNSKNISARCDELLKSIKSDETRLQEIYALKTHIRNYAKSKHIFEEYKDSRYDKDFFESHRDVLMLRKSAKKAFNEFKLKNGNEIPLPKIAELDAEYFEILNRKKKNYELYQQTKKEMKDWVVAEKIVSSILQEETEKDIHKRQDKEKELGYKSYL